VVLNRDRGQAPWSTHDPDFRIEKPFDVDPFSVPFSDKAEAAYRHGDQFEKRRKLMEAWAPFLYIA
jgi:hypothetical protein